MTRIDLISGFLGSGKTTWIKRWVTHPLYAEFVEKTYIIENEFGQVSIDPTVLSQHGLNVSELSAGCICCSIVGDFTRYLEDLIENTQPERVIIEPTGVAKLSEVIEACKTLQRKGLAEIGQALTLIDATQAELYMENFGEFYLDQIKSAHQLVFTKTEQMPFDALCTLKTACSKLNPLATQLISEELSHEAIVMAMDLQFDPFPNRDIFQMVTPPHHHTHGAHHRFQSIGFKGAFSIEKSVLIETLHTVFSNPHNHLNLVRGKGIFKTPQGGIKFDWTGGDLQFEACSPPSENLCCFIGTSLDFEALEGTLASLSLSKICR